MEYKTVLKNPETLIEIDNTVKTLKVDTKTTGVRRFCSHCKMQNIVMGAVVILTLISLLTQLPLHMQVNNHQKQLKVNGEKLKDLLIAYEIQMQQIRGTDFNVKTDKTGVRNQRTVSTTTPHFYLTGPDQRSQATENGIFLWSPPPHRSFGHNDDFSTDLTERNRGDGYFTKVIIHQTGVYFVFAKVTANGRSQMSYSDPPPVGIVLMKESSGGEEEELDISWVTQDDRGQNYGIAARHSQESNYPMDSLSVSGLYMLEVNDKIYIQVPQETSLRRNDRFLAEKLKARFGAFLVESCSSC